MVGEEARRYVCFVTDDGERFEGASLLQCVVVDEQPPAQRADVTEQKKIWIAKAQYPQIAKALALPTPMGNVALAAVLFPFAVKFDCGLSVDVTVINGETGPYVESQLFNPANDDLLESLPPRQNILGAYRFETVEHGVLLVEVLTKE
jgi:hypothetical protein